MIFSKDKLLKLKRALLNLGEISTDEGLLIYDGENLEVGKEVFVEGDEGLVPAKDGLYTYNNEIIEVEGGVVKTISEKEVEQPIEEVVEEVIEPMEEQPKENPTEEPTISTDELQAIIDEQKAMIEELKAEIETIKAENEELKKKLEEPAAQPAEEEFKKENPVKEEKKIDFSKYIKRNK
jgi:predicted RNase H-like nuclease (RuvC/YqgF family)